jgi:phospholipid/cholesterol/gamma-HCH transport system substrate-binding protein
MSKGNSNGGREARVEIVVGVFVALILVALGVFTIVVSGASLFRDGNFVIEVVIPDAMGLRRNDPVIAKGTTVGTVSKVYYDQDGVHVEAELTAPVVFYENYRITVVATSILGGRQLVLFEGDPARKIIEDVSGLKGEKPADIMEDATAAVERIRKFLETDALDNLRDVSEDLKQISGRLERGEGTLGKLLSSDDEVYTNLNATVANLRLVTDRVAQGKGTLGKLMSEDSEMFDNINGAVSDVREMLDDAREASTLSTFSSMLFSGF